MLKIGAQNGCDVAMLSKRLLATTISKTRANASLSSKRERVPPTGMTISPFALFVKEQYTKKSVHGSDVVANMKNIANNWKQLGEADKKRIVNDSIAFRQNRLNEFRSLSTEEQKQKIAESTADKESRAKRKIRSMRREERTQSGHPARPSTSFQLFVKERFPILHDTAEGKKSPASQLLSQIASEWKTLERGMKEVSYCYHASKPYMQSAKKSYEKRSASERDAYQKAISIWTEEQKKASKISKTTTPAK